MVEPRVSVAIPVFNEESALPGLLERTLAVLDALPGGPHEIVLVDDGSRDGTLAAIERMAARDPRITAVALSRNFGHQSALSAALDHAGGDAVVVMDGDGQDPPELIPRFLEEFHRGQDVVYAVRVARKEGALLRLCYDLFYRLIKLLADIDLPLGAGDFGLMSRRVVDLVRRSPERSRYLRGLRSWMGFRQVGIEVERAARTAGRSKYSPSKLLQLAADGIFAFSVIPLRLAALLGALAMGSALLFAVYSLYAKLVLGRTPQGFTALILAITFLSGVQLVFLGVIGEYVGRIYREVKQRPHYVVDRVISGRPRAAR